MNKLVKSLHEKHKLTVWLSDRSEIPHGAVDAPLHAKTELMYMTKVLLNDHIFPMLEAIPIKKEEMSRDASSLLTFEQISQQYRIPVEAVHDINAPALIEKAKVFKPDLILACHFMLIFKKDMLAVPRMVHQDNKHLLCR